MGTVLFTWELGGGLGHLMLISPMARSLAAQGHRVVVAAKNIVAAHGVLGDSKIELLSTPRSQFNLPFARQETYAHLLANVGFHDSAVVESHCQVWKNVYRTLRSDLIVFDNSPMAMLAARGETARKAIVGLGFFMPPDAYPLPAFKPGEALDWKKINEIEDGLLRRANTFLASRDQLPMQRMAQIYGDVDERFLTTYSELDHFPDRGPVEYWGPINSGHVGGKDPVWPECTGKKIYAYLRAFPELFQLLQVLKDSGQPTIVFGERLDAAVIRRFTCRSIRFEDERLNVARVSEECDVAITHAGVTTTAMMLRAGKPVLVVPLTEEQGMVARRIHAGGAGLGVLPDQPAEFGRRFKLVLEERRYRDGANRLAEKLREVDLEKNESEIVRRLGLMLE